MEYFSFINYGGFPLFRAGIDVGDGAKLSREFVLIRIENNYCRSSTLEAVASVVKTLGGSDSGCYFYH